jgi:hypothetical protein
LASALTRACSHADAILLSESSRSPLAAQGRLGAVAARSECPHIDNLVDVADPGSYVADETTKLANLLPVL